MYHAVSEPAKTVRWIFYRLAPQRRENADSVDVNNVADQRERENRITSLPIA